MKGVEFQAMGISEPMCPANPKERRIGKRRTSKAVRRNARRWLADDHETKGYPLFGFGWWT